MASHHSDWRSSIELTDTYIAADNVLYPGAPDYLEYVNTPVFFETQLVEAGQSCVGLRKHRLC